MNQVGYLSAALVIVPATGGQGFSRSDVQTPLIFFKISGLATG
jgi:hypothetical protein